MEETGAKFALVLSGGGARGAYEAGVLDYIRSRLPAEIAAAPLFHIYTGTSIGAANAAFAAANAHDPARQGAGLRALWGGVTDEQVYRSDRRALTGFLIKSGTFMAAKFLGLERLLEKRRKAEAAPFSFKGVLDPSPFVNYVRRHVSWPSLHRNVRHGVIDAVAVSATHMMSGEVAVFVEKHRDVHYREGGSHAKFCTLSPKHVQASGAIPLLFPCQRIGRHYFGDGSLRQNTPMSPAIHLGADRLLVVSTYYKRNELPPPGAGNVPVECAPTVGDILGTYLDSIFIEKLDYDLEQMRRINGLIQDFEELYGEPALRLVNARRRGRSSRESSRQEIKKIEPFVIAPSQDLGALAYDHFMRLLARRASLTPIQKFFSRIIEGSPDTHNDLVSYLMFDHEYLESLIQLGYEDAGRQHEQLLRFFNGQPVAEAPLAGASAMDGRIALALRGERLAPRPLADKLSAVSRALPGCRPREDAWPGAGAPEQTGFRG